MAKKNVIRQDIVQITFDSNTKELLKITDSVEDIKKSFAGGIGDDALEDLKNNANKAKEGFEDLEDQSDKLKKGLDDVEKSGGKAGDTLKKIASVSFKAVAAGIAATSAAVGALVKEAVQSYADYEQLVGGVETLLGAKGAKSVEEYAEITGKSVDAVKDEYATLMKSQELVLENANKAYKTAGLSANDYMETVTSFSASLLQSVGGDTVKAAELADMALTDMSDNANKMGSDMELIQNAYSGFAKGNFTMLDNLKLGYGGTKTEMARLIKDAAKLDKSVDANDQSYGNIVKAIHAVQENLGILGTTQKEADKTISGSLASMKASWSNTLRSLISGGDDFEDHVDSLIDSVMTFKDNVMPAILKGLSGVGKLIEKLAPEIEKHFPKLVEELLPPLIKAATSLFIGLVKALPSIIKTIAGEIPNILASLGEAIADAFGEQFPALKKFSKMIKENAASIKKATPIILGLVGAFMAFKKLKGATSIFSGLSGLFGKKGGLGGAGGAGGKGGLFGGLADLAKMKTTTVLKGMANLAIVLGGFMILATVVAAAAPAIAKLSDGKSLLELAGIMGALGVLGGSLTKVASIVSKVPFTAVLMGLANIGTALGGFGLIVTAFGALSKIPGLNNFIESGGELLAKLCGIIGEMVGSIIGGIGVGITNALPAIGENLTAFIESIKPIFSMTEGVNTKGIGDFFESVGSFLLQMAGSNVLSFFAGGNNLTGIGAELLTFATESEGFFNKVATFSEDGMKKAAMLFKSLADIGNVPNTGGIGQWFSGTNDYEALADGLEQLSSAKVTGFFNTVSGITEVGFTNAEKLFGVLSKLGGAIPNTGGISQWFTGTNDYEALAEGLGTLSGENVTKFFNMVSALPENALPMAEQMFTTLSKLGGAIPNTGGISQWFTGTNDYEDLAEGLKALSGEGVVRFFNMVATMKDNALPKTEELFSVLSNLGSAIPNTGGVSQWFTGKNDYSSMASGLKLIGSGVSSLYKQLNGIEDFKKMSALFVALGGLEDAIPSSGGMAQWFTGDNDIGSLGIQLQTFAKASGGFFKMVNAINLDNLNGMWKSLKGANGLTKDLTIQVDKNIDDIVKKISGLPKKMGDALKKGGKTLGDSLVSVWKTAVEASVKPVNKLLSGANHVLKQFGSKKKVIEWEPYAKGTGGHRGGNAVVNDGRGAELIQMPNGRMFIPSGRNIFLPNAPKGMKVLPAEQTAQLMGKSSPTFHYAKGVGDVWSYVDNASGLVNKIAEGVSYKGMSGFALNLGRGIVSTFKGEMTSWVDKLFEENGGKSLASYVASKGVKQWLSTVVQALKMEGQYSLGNVARTLFQMQTESGGNPYAINLWDSNAKKGTPSKGLMQVIDPTFKAYARKGYDKNIYDPLSNILASVRYATSRYGSLSKAYRGVGYSNGVGTITMPNRSVNLSYTPESDSRYFSTSSYESNTYAPQFNLTISGSNDDRVLARKVKNWINEAMNETFESFDRKSPKMVEV